MNDAQVKIVMQSEYYVLNGCMCSRSFAYLAAKELVEDDFLPGTICRPIFNAMKELVGIGDVINRVSVSKRLMTRGIDLGVELAGLSEYSYSGTENHFRYYLDQVKENGRKRRLKNLANKFGADKQDEVPASQIVKELISEAQKIAEGSDPRGGANMDDAVREHDNFVDQLMAGEIKTISGPLHGLESIVLYPGNQVVVGARTSVGKSALAVHWATSLARTGHRVLFVFAEMTQVEMVQRIASDVAGLGIGLMRKRNVKLSGHRAFLDFRSEIRESNGELRVRYFPGANEIDIKSELDAMAITGGTDVIFVDYIQALECEAMKNKPLRERIGYLSRWCRKQGDIRGMVTIVMSQLVRPGKEDRYTNREPTIWDLKESGNLENDPDVVILLHKEKTDNYRNWNVKVSCVKNRNGSLCDWTYTFDSWTAQWS